MKSDVLVLLAFSACVAALAFPRPALFEEKKPQTFKLHGRMRQLARRQCSSSSSYSCSGSSSSSYNPSSSSSSSYPNMPAPGNGTLTEDPGMDYNIEIALGSSGTPVSLAIDTGSSDMLINTNAVPAGDPSVTSQGSACYESYGGVSGQRASGTIYNAATYTMAGATLSNYFCNAATQYQDGLLGLGFPSSGPQGVAAQTGTSPLLALQNAGIQSFAIYIGLQGTGALTLGGYDAAYIQGGNTALFTTEAVTPIPGSGHWAFGFTGYSANGNSGTPDTTQAFLDSGATGIRVDPTTASSIWASVGASSSGGAIDCAASAPDITFTFGSGTTYTLPSSIYITHSSPTQCHVAVQPITSYGSAPQAARAAVIGNPFIKAYYSYFDIANKQIQFAPSAG